VVCWLGVHGVGWITGVVAGMGWHTPVSASDALGAGGWPSWRSAVRAHLELTRPPNLATAAADVFAGFAVASAFAPPLASLLPLAVAGVALYAGGVVLNDVFDAGLDAVERPERPIPSGRASLSGAAALGAGALTLGVSLAWSVSAASGVIALATAAAAVLYDARGKHHPWLGPLNMGACRGLNLLLGVSAAAGALQGRWWLALAPVLYIAAVTAVSRGEVHGGDRRSAGAALALMAATLAGLLACPFLGGTAWAWPFSGLLAWRVGPAYLRAWRVPDAGVARAAVRAGVLSLVALDAALAAGFGGPWWGLLTLAWLLAASRLARLMAVT
jgi:4-hydroxybenzoate polyprenyltransferase